MKKFLQTPIQSHIILFFIAFILVLALGWHTIFIDHDHPAEIFGEGIRAIVHGENKKFWLFFLSLMAFLGAGILWSFRPLRLASHRTYLTFDFSKVFDPIRTSLRKGIMHPKLCD